MCMHTSVYAHQCICTPVYMHTTVHMHTTTPVAEHLHSPVMQGRQEGHAMGFALPACTCCLFPVWSRNFANQKIHARPSCKAGKKDTRWALIQLPTHAASSLSDCATLVVDHSHLPTMQGQQGEDARPLPFLFEVQLNPKSHTTPIIGAVCLSKTTTD